MTQDKDGKIEIVGTQQAYAGWTRLYVATIRLPDGRTIKREIEDHGGAICVLPYNPILKTAVLVRQSRGPVVVSPPLGNRRWQPLPGSSKITMPRPACTARSWRRRC